ncbi:hypothetical protein MNBD_GAMMA22-81 [hydrothermal vent metagenome]|uniref:DUF4124 domain-containing protein n=1 Tax=hydrothermal vent metagenome TaxID=652676 RepID=A0A3B1AK73_9ZZZZ
MLIYKSAYYSILLFSFLLISNSSYSTDIYKWTDKDGTVHFGDRPEQQQNSATLYKVPKNNSSNVSSSNKERAQKQKKLLDSFAADRRAKKELQSKKNKQAKIRKYNCKVSKDKLIRYQNASRIYVRNELGEKVFLDDEQRLKETNLLKQQSEKWCK